MDRLTRRLPAGISGPTLVTHLSTISTGGSSWILSGFVILIPYRNISNKEKVAEDGGDEAVQR